MNYKQLIWEHHHYRFGLAGKGQANVIKSVLESRRGRVLNIGCGPWAEKLDNLSVYCDALIAVDNSLGFVQMVKPKVPCPNIMLLLADAHRLPFSNQSLDHVLALGLSAEIPDAAPVMAEFCRVC